MTNIKAKVISSIESSLIDFKNSKGMHNFSVNHTTVSQKVYYAHIWDIIDKSKFITYCTLITKIHDKLINNIKNK